MVGSAQDNVVENFDFKELPGSDEIASNLDVGFGWSRLTTRMIMRDYDCSGARHNSKPEDFTGMA